MIFPGLFLWQGNTWGIVLFVPVALTVHYGVILREERYLADRFCDAYAGYMRRVRS